MSAHDAERDARLFLNDVYARQPEGTVIAVGSKSKPHYVLNAAGALPWIVGKTDVYCRVTLLAHQPKTGRGKAVDSVALPGLVADLDVNGGPDSRGNAVAGAFDTREAAIECAHSIAQPTLIVCSGYGIQPWWLTHTMEALTCDEDRDRVAAIARAWQHALRAQAGVDKVDGVHDLTRVMRAPGSFNGKGETPVPVVLLDNGGPRYDLRELAELAPASDDRDARMLASAAIDGDLDEVEAGRLLERHDKLTRFVRRTGKAPKKGSPSEWDATLACRAAELGLTDAQIATLIRYARRLHDDPKGERVDYVERTIAFAHTKVRSIDDATSADAILAQLTERVGAAQIGLAVANVIVSGHGDEAMAALVLSDGSTVEFSRLDHVATPSRLSHRLAADAGIALDFSTIAAAKIAALMRRYAGRSNETHRHELAIDWGLEFLRLAEPSNFHWKNTDERWRVWSELADRDPDRPPPRTMLDVETQFTRSAAAYATHTLVAHDLDSGQRYVRSGWMQEFVRRTGSREAQGDVVQLLTRVGWQRPLNEKARITVHEPGGERQVGFAVFVVPSGWGTV
jgi:hypothetical protein